MAAFSVLMAIALFGLAISALGIAHQLLPRQFTPAQQGKITAWEQSRRWRALPAGQIFPPKVSYALSATTVEGNQGLNLTATRLGIGSSTGCAQSLPAATAQVIDKFGCAAVLRATYADSTSSLVATIAVVVLPDAGKAQAAASQLKAESPGAKLALVEPLSVAGTEAATFGDEQRQQSDVTSAGPYLIMTVAGYADGRPHVRHSGHPYTDLEMDNFSSGLASSAQRVLNPTLPTPNCPGAPGC
jgi:hypothetical protein